MNQTRPQPEKKRRRRRRTPTMQQASQKRYNHQEGL